MLTSSRLRATSAAPTYFKSFFHDATKITFNDGGIKYNNPVSLSDNERKILWPSLAKHDPDLLLSIGTGFDGGANTPQTNPGPRSIAGIEGYLRRMLRIALDAIQDNLDCENAWLKFTRKLQINENDERKRKYRRLNPDFTGSLPKIDDVTQIDDLEKKTKQTFLQYPAIYESIADTLIASLFYFEMCLVIQTGPGGWACRGK